MKKTLIAVNLALLGLGSSAYAGSDGVSTAPYTLTEIYGVPITNAMATSWVFSLVLVLAIRLAVRKRALIPTRAQVMVEGLMEGVKDLIAPIVGKPMVRPTFPLLVGFFIFILIQNWSGLLPGVGTFGLYDETGHLVYWMRPGNADLNMTLALALVSFVAWMYYVLRYAGMKSFVQHTFGNKADRKEVPAAIYYFLFLIFFAVGIIEIISILFRPVSLSFRLFGNVFGGENLLGSMHGLFKWVLPTPFYFLELLIGFVQALVFTLLVAVYIGLVCNHDEAH